MPLKSNFEIMATYNQQTNHNTYTTASKLSAEALARDRGAFFGSIIATLNHILVGDTIWLKRFSQHQANFSSLEYVRGLEPPQSLDAILYTVFDELKTKREAMDKAIVAFTQELTEETLSQPLSYRNTKGQSFTKHFDHLLLHFFNHQTHHRGQVSTLLNQEGLDIGVTDLLVNLPDVK